MRILSGLTYDRNPFVYMKFSGDGGLAVPACLGRQIHNDRSLLHHANHLQKRTVSELLPLVEFMNVPHL